MNLHKNIWRGAVQDSTHQNSLLFQSSMLLCFIAHRKPCFSAARCKTLVPYRLEHAVVKTDTLKSCLLMAHSSSALSSQWWWSPLWRTKRQMWKPVELWTLPSLPVTSQDEEGPGFYSLLGQVKSCNEQLLVLSTAAGSGIHIFVYLAGPEKPLTVHLRRQACTLAENKGRDISKHLASLTTPSIYLVKSYIADFLLVILPVKIHKNYLQCDCRREFAAKVQASILNYDV